MAQYASCAPDKPELGQRAQSIHLEPGVPGNNTQYNVQLQARPVSNSLSDLQPANQAMGQSPPGA